MNESAILKHILLRCGRGTSRLWRNNVGAYRDKTGNWVRYGVCNPGGSDLIGWQQILITPDHVGQTFAVFAAIEVKTKTGRITFDQSRFLNIVKKAGGVAGVARSPEEAELLLTNART